MIANSNPGEYYGARDGSVTTLKNAAKSMVKLEEAISESKSRQAKHAANADELVEKRKVQLLRIAEEKKNQLNFARVLGRNALEAKSLLPHGQFEKWVVNETGLSVRAVREYMRLASPKSAPEKTGADLGQRVVTILTAEGVPEAALAEAKKRAESGEQITQKVAREIVAKHTAPIATNRIGAALEETYGSSQPQVTAEAEPRPASTATAESPKPVKPVAAPQSLSDKQKLAKAMELIASMESPDTQYEAVIQTVALLHPEDRGELFSKLNSIYSSQGEPKQVELFAGDPADLVPPKKINTPEVRKAWTRWCDSNKAKGHPLTIEEGKSQLRLLATGKPETAVERIEYALATRSDKIPLARELPKDFEEPTEEAVLGYAKPVGVPESVARDFFRHYAAQGWVLGNGQPITDWKQSLHAWNKNQSDRSRPQIQSKFDEPDTPDPLTTAKWGKSRLTKNAG